MMATQSSLQDCYFYFYSSCTKGDECPFRHCELALGTETVCSLWREGRCFRSNCKFRHMESRINRSTIPCYWENQPIGCRKPHCVFMHRKSRNGVQVVKDTPGLILPTSDGKKSPNHADFSDVPNMPNNVALVEKVVESDVLEDPSLAPVQPLVLKFDEGEESDTESITSTPVKQGDKKTALARNNLSVTAAGAVEDKDFGIKTLEQIRMEKIHKESDSFYGGAYASTPVDATRHAEQHYPPKADFLALPKDSSSDKSLPAPITEPKLSGVEGEIDLRGRLLNRRNAPSNKVNQVKRLINFKKQNGNQVEVVSKKLDFKIKTLAEIRREKGNKQSQSEVAMNNDALPSLEEKRPLNNTKQRTLKKPKINRKSKECVSAGLKQDVAEQNGAEMTTNHLVSNGVNRASPKSSEDSLLVLNKNSSNSSPVMKIDSINLFYGKRKSDDDSCPTSSKIIKIDGGAGQENRVNACSDGIDESSHIQTCLQHPEIQSPLAAKENSDTSSSTLTSTSPNHTQDKVTVSHSVPDIEMNGVVTPTPASLSSSLSPCHKSEEKSVHASNDNSTVLPKPTKSIPCPDIGAGKDNLIDRSMSVDAELDELLGDDDMNMDEIDATPNDDILLEIEEFLES